MGRLIDLKRNLHIGKETCKRDCMGKETCKRNAYIGKETCKRDVQKRWYLTGQADQTDYEM